MNNFKDNEDILLKNDLQKAFQNPDILAKQFTVSDKIVFFSSIAGHFSQMMLYARDGEPFSVCVPKIKKYIMYKLFNVPETF